MLQCLLQQENSLCSITHNTKLPQIKRHSPESVHITHRNKSTLNTVSTALPWLFCQGHLWSCNYTASCASTFKNDLQYRDHLASLIILMLIGSSVACLFRAQGEWRMIPKSSILMLSHCMPLLTEENTVIADHECVQNGNDFGDGIFWRYMHHRLQPRDCPKYHQHSH